jgi:hypothetical protein
MQADAAIDVEAVRATGAWTMLVDATRTFRVVEQRADDVLRERAFTLERPQLGDASIDVGAHLGRERVESLAKQLPFCTNEDRDVREPTTARSAATMTRPPRARLGGLARAMFDFGVDREEALSHRGNEQTSCRAVATPSCR